MKIDTAGLIVSLAALTVVNFSSGYVAQAATNVLKNVGGSAVRVAHSEGTVGNNLNLDVFSTSPRVAGAPVVLVITDEDVPHAVHVSVSAGRLVPYPLWIASENFSPYIQKNTFNRDWTKFTAIRGTMTIPVEPFNSTYGIDNISRGVQAVYLYYPPDSASIVKIDDMKAYHIPAASVFSKIKVVPTVVNRVDFNDSLRFYEGFNNHLTPFSSYTQTLKTDAVSGSAGVVLSPRAGLYSLNHNLKYFTWENPKIGQSVLFNSVTTNVPVNSSNDFNISYGVQGTGVLVDGLHVVHGATSTSQSGGGQNNPIPPRPSSISPYISIPLTVLAAGAGVFIFFIIRRRRRRNHE